MICLVLGVKTAWKMALGMLSHLDFLEETDKIDLNKQKDRKEKIRGVPRQVCIDDHEY